MDEGGSQSCSGKGEPDIPLQNPNNIPLQNPRLDSASTLHPPSSDIHRQVPSPIWNGRGGSGAEVGPRSTWPGHVLRRRPAGAGCAII